MPHTTHAYPFESRIGRFAAALSLRCSADDALRSFLLTLSPRGDVMSLTFDGGAQGWHEHTAALKAANTPHLLYDPLDDGAEYIWLHWHHIEQDVMERLLDQRFTDDDLQPAPWLPGRASPPLERVPASWGVMF
jgi:hypothetical protein